MSNSLLFDFTVDKPAKTIYIKREFDAPLSLVWAAFTIAEILDQWVAPAPMISKTKYMNFEVGGKRFYAMVAPDGTERWSLQTYLAIHPMSHIKLWNTFADANENPDPTGSDWDYYFSEENGITTVSITIFNESFERMEKLLEGFTLGFTASLQNLESWLESQKGS